MPERRLVNVSDVYYSQADIGSTFGRSTRHAGQPLEILIQDLLEGRVRAEDEGLILDVIDCGGRLIALSNRRLYCLKMYSDQIQAVVRVLVDVWPLREDAILPD